jgi:PAS domain S-box-containing protein
VPHFICPNCKERSVDIDRKEGFYNEAVACHHCGFGFLFELQDDYYPAPTTGLVVCDQQGRILAIGRGVFELTGWSEQDLLGADLVQGLGLNGFEEERNPARLALEYGVRRLDERIALRARSGHVKPITADFFPALDDDGGLLVALTPRAAEPAAPAR